MDQKLTARFLNSIGIENDEEFDLSFEYIKKIENNTVFDYCMRKKTPWKSNELDIFLNALQTIKYKYQISFIYDSEIKAEDIAEIVSSRLDFRLDKPYKLEIDPLTCLVDIKVEPDEINIEQEVEDLDSLMTFLCYNAKIKYSVNKKEDYHQTTSEEKESFELENKLEEEESASKAIESFKKARIAEIEEEKFKESFKKGNYVDVEIGDIDSNSGAVSFNGQVFETSSRETKKGGVVYKIGVFDRKTLNSINVTFFSNDTVLTEELLEDAFKEPGKFVEIKGRVSIDKFKHEIMVTGHYFQVTEGPEPRKDDYDEKRVELHLHTKFSEMDAVSSIDEYCRTAKSMGHKAIAITDHGVVQGYPQAQAAAKKYGIKMIYGAEIYMIEDYFYGTINAKDIDLNNAPIVCFDLESTGLNIRYDSITEFGAVKIEHGMVTDTIDILIKPEVEIPHNIEIKTHITNEMVANCPTIDKVLPQILEFMKGSIIISHNINFDYRMLNEAMERYGFGKLEFPAIDTLALSRHFFPEFKAHSLKALCKRLDVAYDSESAHRANYDAEVLAKAWMGLKPVIEKECPKYNLLDLEKFPITLIDLKNYKRWSKHITLYCKNQASLKKLYELISISHVDHMGDAPFLMRSEIEKNRDYFVIGSACFNGEVYEQSARGNAEHLRNAIKFYDFIEIQPLENYSFLINMNEVNSLDALKQNLKDIINEANLLGKMIVATGDVHYNNPEDKIFRDVFIANPGIGGTPHPLNPYGRKDLPEFENPDQHYRSTKEMMDAFEWLGHEKAYEYVIKNSNLIADMCEEVVPIPPGTYPPSIENCDNLLRELCYKTAHEWYGDIDDPNDPAKVIIKERLDKELNGIITHGYAVIYYIAHKLIEKANEDGYLIGSRGSVGSSFAATMAQITEVNPLAPHYRCPHCKKTIFYEGHDITSGFDLPPMKCPDCGEEMIRDGQTIPFQTFLGFNADKTPDIDLNFPTDYQATAHLYTKVLLGENNVYRAGTISTVKFKTAYGYVRKYFEEKNIEPDSVKKSKIATIAFGCTDVKRTTGQHPGGIVVIPNDYSVYDFTPVQFPAGDTDAAWKTTHFDFHAIHDTILKLDMLGHVDPQALKMMSDLTGKDCRTLPLTDPQVISLFSTDKALKLQHKYMKPDNGAIGIPEFGTQFVRQMLRETEPKTFSDLMIISGLSHGTNVWANNQQNIVREGITNLKGLIGCRDDIMSYLMTKGIDGLPSFHIMETVRKGKKLKDDQLELMKSHNVPQYYIDSCKKIKYLFPKGHACAYVTMAVRVGYYKVYYPLAYYATYLTLRCEQFDIEVMTKGIDAVYNRLEDFHKRRQSGNPELALSTKEEGIEQTLESVLELYERGFKISNLSLEKSDSTNFIIDYENKALIPPFKVLDGLGEKGAISIIEARNERPFISKKDLLDRAKISKTNLKQLEMLGVVDSLSEDNQLSLFNFSF